MYHIIINPASRSGKGSKIWTHKVEPKLRAKNIPYQSYLSAKAGDVSAYVKEILHAEQGKDICLIILGGDGTFNEALQAAADRKNVTLGYIPTGSSNDLARDLKIPSDPEKALELILTSKNRHTMDMGKVTGSDGKSRNFAVSCGIGYDAAVCEEVMRSNLKMFLNKLGLGKLSYLGIALKQLLTMKKAYARLILDDNHKIELNNMIFTAAMIHEYEGGGFRFCPDADDSDGVLDLCVAGDLSKGKVLLALPAAFKGSHYRFGGITAHTAKEVTIESSSPLWVHTDGEIFGKTDSVTITCVQNAVNIIVS